MSTLWVIGDSTVSSFEDKYYYPRYGYGTMLDKYLNDNVKVVNIALSGRSSKSYLSEPEYNTLINGMKQGDYLLIGFGHNDEKTEKERYTSPVGDYMTEGTFANTLYVNYIRKARNAGCYPILCTPIVRRSASGEWKATELHITQDVAQYKGGDYALAVRELGKAVGVPVIDMTQLTRDEYEKLGSDNTIYLHAWPSNNKLSVDNTHTNIWGARVNAYMIMSAVKELNISGLSENVVNIDNNPLDYKEKFLVSNKDYVPVVFSDKLPDSRLFKDYGEYKAAVFGDVLGEVDDTDFTLGTDANGDMNIAVRNNRGKISAVTDGIAMYYKKVDITEHFTLTATVKVNKIFANDQVSFGLMVRDDMYIDKKMPDVLGDYIAAAPLNLTYKDQAWSCFARKNSELMQGSVTGRELKPGDTVEACIKSNPDGYAVKLGDGEFLTGGFDFKLTAVDPKHVYAGFFVSRNADVTFTDIEYTEN